MRTSLVHLRLGIAACVVSVVLSPSPAHAGSGAAWAGVVGAVAFGAGDEAEGPSAHQRADAAFRGGRFEDAAALYEGITAEHPDDAVAWYRLGYSLHALKRFEAAAEAHARAAEFDMNPAGHRAGAMYNLACARAMLGDKDGALEALEWVVGAGFAQPGLMRADTDLVSLRGDARFEAVVARAAANEAELPIHHFDFWIGAWDVFNPAGKKVGENVIRALHDGHVLEENWTSARGSTGMSMNFYDPERGSWRQVWVDQWGGIVEYEGAFRDGAMRMEGWRIEPTGARKLQRVSFTPNADGSVRQFIEESGDGGETWTVYFDGRYVKKDSLQPASADDHDG